MLFWIRRPMAQVTPCEGTDDSLSPLTDHKVSRPLVQNALTSDAARSAYGPGGKARALAQQREDALGRLVRLGQHRGAGLLQDVELGELRHLGRHVHVADAR